MSIRNIIFICSDVRGITYDKNNIPNGEPIEINQVAKTTFRRYKVGDYLSITLKEHYETKKGKMLDLETQKVLCKVIKKYKNVIYVNIVKE